MQLLITLLFLALSIGSFPLNAQEVPPAYRDIIERYERQLANHPKDFELTKALGDTYYYFKDYGKAITYYQEALALNPGDTATEVSLALAYLESNDFSRSQDLLDKLYSQDPKNVDVISGLGRIQALHHHYKTARAYYRKALEINPKHFATLYFLGELEGSQKHYAKAEKIFKDLLQRDPKATWVQEALIRTQVAPAIAAIRNLESQGLLSAAIANAKGELQQRPGNIDLIVTLADLYTKAHRYQKAIELLKKPLQENPHSSDLLANLGMVYLAQGEVMLADRAFRQVLTHDLSNPIALIGLGRVSETIGDPATANLYYKRALLIEPQNIEALNRLADLALQIQDFGTARSYYLKLQKLHPDLPWIKNALTLTDMGPMLIKAKVQKEKGRSARAIRIYKRLLKQHPDQLDLYLLLGKLYLSLGRNEEAILLYQEALKLKLDKEPLWLVLGEAYLAEGRLDLAKEMFDKASRFNETRTEALIGLGKVAMRLGDIKEAEYFYQSALNFDGNNIDALSFLASLRLQQKRYSLAEQLYGKILWLEPKAEWARNALELAKLGAPLDRIDSLMQGEKWQEALPLLTSLASEYPDQMILYLKLGEIYLHLGAIDKALATYRTGLKRNPQFLPLQSAIGLLYLSQDKLVKAYKTFVDVLAKDPDQVEALDGLGRLKEELGDLEGAKELYLQAVAVSQDDVASLADLANLYFHRENYRAASVLYAKLLTLLPDKAWIKKALEDSKHAAMLKKIQRLQKEKKYEQVEKLYRKLISKEPERADYYILFGKFYEQIKQLPDALAIYSEGLALLPSNAALKTALGFAEIANGDLAKADKLFDEAIAKEPNNAEAYAGLGLAAERRQHVEEAKSLYRKALDIDKDNITSLTYLASLSMKQREYLQAKLLFKRIAALDPAATWVKQAELEADFGPLLDKIKMADEAKDFQEAEILYRELLAAVPNNEGFTVQAGEFLIRRKQYQKAIDLYKSALAANKTSIPLEVALGFAYLSAERPKESYATFQNVLSQDSSNVDALVGLGRLEMLAGRTEQAESYYDKALKIEPSSIAVLSSIASLRMSQKRYGEAEAIYEDLFKRYPKELWIKYALESAKYAPSLDEIRRLEASDDLTKALELYQKLVWIAPDNADFYLGLGQVYVRLKRYEEAYEVYRQGLNVRPDVNELRVALGYAYLFANEPDNADMVLREALAKGSATPEIIAGLGRAQALQKYDEDAEELYRRALAQNPNSVSVLTFYGELLMKEHRYDEAQVIYSKLIEIDPQVTWIYRAIEDARDGTLRDLASWYEDQADYDTAAVLYAELIALAPDNPGRYAPLARVYMSKEEYEIAICIYQQGLDIDENATYLTRGMALAYIKLRDYVTSRCLLTALVAGDPRDAEAWAGLAKIEELDGSECLAEEYYRYALSLDSENITAISYLSEFRLHQQRVFDAAYLYYDLYNINPRPKWVRSGYNLLLFPTHPTIFVEGGYHEEDQWDPTTDQWTARYQVYGMRAALNYPWSNEWIFGGRIADEYYVLKDTAEHFTIYSFDVQRLYASAIYNYCPHWGIDARIGASLFSPYQKSSFTLSRGIIPEFTLTMHYQKRLEKALFGFSSDVDLVARNFATNRAKLVGRYFLMGRYEREIIKKGVLGVEADAYFYSDYVNNRSQKLAGWFDWRPPCYDKYLILRYYFKYQHFDKNIPDYYTYNYQVINHLQVTLEKTWTLPCFDLFYTNIGYAHGWQDTRTRFAQIIVVNPVGGLQPFIMDRRNYNYFFGNVNFSANCLAMGFTADFYRDSKKYTIWSVLANLTWRF